MFLYSLIGFDPVFISLIGTLPLDSVAKQVVIFMEQWVSKSGLASIRQPDGNLWSALLHKTV